MGSSRAGERDPPNASGAGQRQRRGADRRGGHVRRFIRRPARNSPVRSLTPVRSQEIAGNSQNGGQEA